MMSRKVAMNWLLKASSLLFTLIFAFPALAQVRWPDRPVDFVVAVDHDAAGDRYVAQIRAALPGRSLRRLHLAGAA